MNRYAQSVDKFWRRFPTIRIDFRN